MDKYRQIILDLFKHESFPYNQENSVNDLLGGRKLILYGAGDGFITFSVSVLRKYGFKPHAVIDRKFKKGDNYYGVPAFNPAEYKPTDEEKNNAIVVITVGKKEYHEEIFNYLQDLGFKNIILAIDIYEYHLYYSTEELEKKGFYYYLENKEQIIDCLELFSDNLSREIYTIFIQTHIMKKPMSIPSRPRSEQYFPKDIVLKKGYSRFINCGAYIGDTIKQLNTLYGKIEALACFEPDPANFALLSKYLCSEYNKIAHIVIAFPCGVFSLETQLHFSCGNKISSAISKRGNYIIQCVALDHVLLGFKPTFISMDVEGAEYEALKGAKELIMENKPDLAICVYHTPNHIWKIPHYLNSLHLGYKFYLRNYTSFTTDTVLYATTGEV